MPLVQPATLSDLFDANGPRAAAGLTKAESDVVQIVTYGRFRSHNARLERRMKNRNNWNFAHGNQDWSHKKKGQATVFLPDLPIFIEQVATVVEKQLTEFSDWFTIDSVGGLPIVDPKQLQAILAHLLDRLWQPGDQPETALPIQTVIGDAIKMAIIESIAVFKVYGVDDERPIYRLEASEPPGPAEMRIGDAIGEDNQARDKVHYRRIQKTVAIAWARSFKLAVELVPYEDHYPDPSPSNLFDIHEVTHHISDLASNPDYDPEIINQLRGAATELEEQLDKRRRENQPIRIMDPWLVRVQEYWGDLVDMKTGQIIEKNIFCTVCNGKLLRPPTKNPFWHQKRPFVKVPLMRTPLSPTHDAMVDRAIGPARAQNEVFSLMVDAGLSAVWGVRQYHPDMIENSADFAKGIAPGSVAVMKRGRDPSQTFMKRLDDAPNLQHADLMLQRLGGAVQQAMSVNDIRAGQLPPRQVKATEIVETQESSNNLFENLSSHFERNGIVPLLELCWLTTWQYLDDFTQPELVQILGPYRAQMLAALDPAERFVLLANNVKFKAEGLRKMAHNVRQFQKITTVINTIFAFPALAMIWDAKYSPIRIVEQLVKSVGIDPLMIERRPGAETIDPHLDPSLMMGTPQNQAMAAALQPTEAGTGVAQQVLASDEGKMAPPNPTGERGGQV